MDSISNEEFSWVEFYRERSQLGHVKFCHLRRGDDVVLNFAAYDAFSPHVQIEVVVVDENTMKFQPEIEVIQRAFAWLNMLYPA